MNHCVADDDAVAVAVFLMARNCRSSSISTTSFFPASNRLINGH